MPETKDFAGALAAAAEAHHEYESNALAGERDEAWAGWYAAYVLGRLGDFATPTQLTTWLAEVGGDDWVASAAEHLTANTA